MEASDASVSEGGGSVFSENPFEELFLQETNGELPPLESKEWEEQADKVLTAALKLVKELKECQPAAALQAASKSAAKAALQVKAEERTGEGGRGVRGRGGKGGRRQTDREKGADAAEQPSRDLVSASLKKATDLLSRLRSLLSLASSPQRAKAIFTDEVLLGATAAMKAHMKETVFICAADPDVVGGKVTMRQCVTTNEIETFFVTLRSVLSAAEELLVLVHVPEQHLHTIAAAAASLFQVPHLSAARQCQKKALDLLCTMQSRFGADVGQSVAMEVSNLLPDIAVRPMSTLKRWEWYDISTGRTLHLFTYVALRVAQAASAPVDRVGISRGTPFDKMVSAGGDSLTVERTISGQVLHQCAIRAESPEMKEKGRFLFTDFWKAAQCPLFPSAMNFVVLLCRGLCLLISRQANALVGVDRQQQAAAAAAEEEGGDDEKEDGEAGEEKKEKGKGAGGGKKKPPPAPTGPGRQALSALDHFTNLLGVSARHVFTDHKESQTLRVDERRSREKGCPCGRNFSATGDGPEDPTEEDENAGRVVRCSRCEAWMHSACAEDAADSLAVSVTVDPINNLPTSVGQWMCDFCALREFAFARADETQRAAPGTLEFVAQGAAEAQEMIRNEQRAAAAEEQQQQQQRDERGAVKVKKEPGLEEEEDEEAYQAMEVEIAMELDKDDNASPCTGAAAAAAAFQNLSTSFEDRLAVCHGLLHATDTGKACDVPKEAGTGGMMRGEMMMENGENAVDIRLNNKVLLSHDHPLFARSRLLTYWACENVEKKRIESSRNKKRGGAAAAAGRAEQKDEKKAKKKRKEEKKRSGSRRRVSSSDEEDEEGEEEEEEMYANGRRGGRRGASSRRSSRAAAAVQKENRGGGRRGKKRDDENQEERPSRNVKRIKMENPDDEPQEMDLDETEKEDEGRGGGSEVAGLGSEEEESRYRSFLAKEWETPILLDGQNRRTSLDLPSGFITRVWQQYRAAALADFRDRALEIVCMETGPAKQGTVRRAGMVLLQEMLSAEPGLVEDSRAQEVIFRGLSDEGAKVSQSVSQAAGWFDECTGGLLQ
uniref:PHD-type domain-containing protein n=2 Tax=Chromera velia CCMP2878 TaxID=1169474 RepID=A0A0G4I916_9ALVE|eukprot:Cvel_2028.t1-p1 / transcript=Cvel_2028.t1 / gene=Cvel_2028 / organism=Chromera_velia_CCMP2878 / gene_product=hypothetical protein / transcript_product=hypothetical protein / location=Cvel_scaffold77:141164-149569(+) / protein_length=1057 / sequence_SO=supercontig / SO=protein_coding / is_pseudo=false